VNCNAAQNLLDAYEDKELSLPDRLSVKRHLQACAACATEQVRIKQLKRALGNKKRYTAPAGLRNHIQSRLQEITSDEKTRGLRNWRWLAFGAAPLASALVAVFITLMLFSSPSQKELWLQAVISAHVRSILTDNLIQVESPDPHKVKPWLSNRLDFSPQVKDLSKEDFPLVGGRLDYIQNRLVAALVYLRRSHTISLFILPAEPDHSSSSQGFSQRGYHMVRWKEAGLRYWVISDLNMEELRSFVTLLNNSKLMHPSPQQKNKVP
jgi:anti-sigma factor RsiW